MCRRQVFFVILFAAILFCWDRAAWSQEPYPSRQVTVVIPNAAGSGPDILIRQLADKLAARFGKPFVVENRGGANGIPAVEYASRSANDGYTLLVGTATALVGNPHLFRNLKYDPTRLTGVSILGSAPMVLTVSPKSDIRSVDDLVRAAKANPGKLSYGAPNVGSQVITERLKLRAGIDLLRVPYRATGQAITDLMGGSIDVLFADLPIMLGAVKNNQVRPLGVSGTARTPLLPDVPTLPELGYSDLVLTLWLGIFGPEELPPDVRGVLDQAMASIMAEPSMKDRMSLAGMDVEYLDSRKVGGFIRSELARWGDFVKGSGIELQD